MRKVSYFLTVFVFNIQLISAELGETTEDVVESKFETKIMEELDEYVTVDAIHDECLNAALSFG